MSSLAVRRGRQGGAVDRQGCSYSAPMALPRTFRIQSVICCYHEPLPDRELFGVFFAPAGTVGETRVWIYR